ncbi:unnamed protein product [Brachionus calyciflorus]|uniref:Uncharacterized protein n=1 Tax=Brachionus calyciflorus TaxID=104777 RepID=A0A813ZN06_9BILA|nr:unnamed protein product [Brachionus calyciflorus]
MCNKSDISLWPFMFVLNEIPIEERYSFENVIIAGLCMDIIKYLINSSNGYYSCLRCLRCLQSGKSIPTEKGSTIIYPYKSYNPTGPPRSIGLYRKHFKKCLKKKTMIAGIKDDCILNDLKYYNAIKNTNIDIMHSLFLGVMKKFFEYWFEHPSSNTYSLKNFLKELDDRLLSIKPPSYVSSLPRSLTKWRKWKSHDFMNFTIHFSLITFSNLMPIEYFHNYMLFVIAIENLFRKEIDKNNLQKIQKCIELFVSQLAKLYNPNIMKSGIHELLHLTDLTNDFGPLNNINCFPFEELNRKITSLIHG